MLAIARLQLQYGGLSLPDTSRPSSTLSEGVGRAPIFAKREPSPRRSLLVPETPVPPIRVLCLALLANARTIKVDDGISVECLPNGEGERIWVHIADVTRWITEGSAMYMEARRRRTTTYLPEGSVPMFPTEVAHDLLSLR